MGQGCYIICWVYLQVSSESYELKVFHEKELDQLLRNLDLSEKLRNGELKCAVCNKTITPDNFGAVFKDRGKIYVVCEDVRCVAEAGNRGRN